MAATQDYAASITGVALRVTRLDANGALLNGPGDSYTTSAFMSVSFTPEYEAGDEITQKSASGSVCVTYKAPDTLKRITMEVAICEPDPELTSLISGGLLLRKSVDYGTAGQANRSVGWASPAVGDDPSGNGVAIEAWSLAIKDGRKSGTLPYFHWVFPYAKLSLSGDRVIENGLLANTFQGYGLGNDQFQAGPDGRWEFPAAADRPYSYARDSYAPTGLSGFYTWHAALTSSISNKALTSEVAVLTTSTPHNFIIGDTVTVTGVGGVFDGSHTITAKTNTTFSFSAVGATNVTSATVTGGTAIVGAGARAVDDLVDLDNGTVDYNVPGSVYYNPELANDYILNSTEDPTT